jgi:hypothetical protein
MSTRVLVLRAPSRTPPSVQKPTIAQSGTCVLEGAIKDDSTFFRFLPPPPPSPPTAPSPPPRSPWSLGGVCNAGDAVDTLTGVPPAIATLSKQAFQHACLLVVQEDIMWLLNCPQPGSIHLQMECHWRAIHELPNVALESKGVSLVRNKSHPVPRGLTDVQKYSGHQWSE